MQVPIKLVSVIVAVLLGPMSSISYSGAWSQPQVVSSKSGFWAVSCSSAESCLATTGGQGDEVLEYSKGGWKAVAAGPVQELNWDVACAGTHFCFFSGHNGRVVALNQGRWVDSQRLFLGSGSPLVSCASQSYCLSLDSQAGGHSSEQAVFDGKGWSVPLAVPGIALGVSLTCPTAGFCVTVDEPDKIATYEHDHWSIGPELPGVRHNVRWISCANEAFCAAADPDGDLFIYRAGTWSTPTKSGLVEPNLSCSSPGFCMAVDLTGRWSEYSGGKWSRPARVGNTSAPLVAVSCAGLGFCLAVGGTSYAFRWSDGSQGSKSLKNTDIFANVATREAQKLELS
jgi:hypothetical protein